MSENEQSGETIVLREQETIRNVGELKALLEPQVDAATIVVEGSAVAGIDTAALQVLAAAALSVRSAGGSVEWQNPSEALTEAATLLALDDHLRLADAVTTDAPDDDDGLCPVF